MLLRFTPAGKNVASSEMVGLIMGAVTRVWAAFVQRNGERRLRGRRTTRTSLFTLTKPTLSVRLSASWLKAALLGNSRLQETAITASSSSEQRQTTGDLFLFKLNSVIVFCRSRNQYCAKYVYLVVLSSSLRGVCAALRPCHAGWHPWWYGTRAAGGYACLACLVSASSGRALVDFCCGRRMHWGPHLLIFLYL